MPILRQSIAYEVGCLPRRLIGRDVEKAPWEVLVVEDDDEMHPLIVRALMKAGIGKDAIKIATTARKGIRAVARRTAQSIEPFFISSDLYLNKAPSGKGRPKKLSKGDEAGPYFIKRAEELLAANGFTRNQVQIAMCTSRKAERARGEIEEIAWQNKNHPGAELTKRIVDFEERDPSAIEQIAIFEKPQNLKELAKTIVDFLERAKAAAAQKPVISPSSEPKTINLAPAGDTPQTSAADANTESGAADSSTLQQVAA